MRLPMQMQEAGEFSEGRTYLAYSSCEIQAEDFKIDETGFSWNPESKKTVQNVNLHPADSPEAEADTDPDFTPQESKLEFESTAERPTIWFSAPPVLDRSIGRVITSDGRHLIFGEKTDTRLTRLDKSGVMLETGGRKNVIRYRIIKSIMFPSGMTSKDE